VTSKKISIESSVLSSLITFTSSLIIGDLSFLSAAAIGYYSIAAIHKPMARAARPSYGAARPVFIQTVLH
jgi:hypothetical protein